MSAMDGFKQVTAKNFAEQGAFFLNAFWAEHQKDAEQIWQVHQKIVEFDLEMDEPGRALKGKENCDVNEFVAHRVIEWAYAKENLPNKPSVKKLRDDFKESIDLDSNKRMALIEYLLYRYLHGKVQDPVGELMKRPQGSNAELEKAQAALDEVMKEIDRIEKLKKKFSDVINNPQSPRFKKSQAQMELEQILAGDNTELNRKQITAQAAIRKAQKLGGADAQGKLWWLQRDLDEAAKYKPGNKR